MKTRASFRLLRTGLIGSIILGLAAGGHLAGGGRLPEPAILAALCALTIVPVAALTHFRLSLPVLAGLLGAGQVWLHWAFCALSDGAARAAPLTSGHAGHSRVAPALETFDVAVPGLAAVSDWQMFAAHAVATLGTALVLARSEQALWAVAAWLRPLVQLPAPWAIVPARVPGPCTAPIALSQNQLVRRMPERRGPPVWVPAA